jgi:hypothetical protein
MRGRGEGEEEWFEQLVGTHVLCLVARLVGFARVRT